MMRVNDLALLPPAPLDVAGPDCGMEAGDLVAENTLRTAVILSLFLRQREEDIPYINVPQNQYYHISLTPRRKLIERISY